MLYDDDPTTSYQPGEMSPGHSGSGTQYEMPTKSYKPDGYNSYTGLPRQYTEQRYDDYEDGGSIMGEFLFSSVVILIGFVIPYLFYLLKKLLKKLSWLSPRVLGMLDKLEPVFIKLTTKLGNRGLKAGLKTNISLRPNESTEIIRDTVSDSLKSKLYVAPNGEPDIIPNTVVEGEEYADTTKNAKIEQIIKDEYDDLLIDPHAIIRRNLKG